MSNVINFNSNNTFNTVSTNAQEQEVNDRMEFLKLEQSKYLQQKILYDLLEDVVYDDHTDAKLKSKVKDIILSENLKQTLSIDNKSLEENESNVLGVAQDITVLTYSESSLLRNLIKLKSTKKVEDLAAQHNEWTELLESIRELGSIQLSQEDKILLEYKNKVIVEQEKYINNLLNLHKLLEEITHTRTVDLPKTMEQKIAECQVEEKINYLKCIIVQEKCRAEIFTETKCSLRAYRELIKDIQLQQRDCRKDIEDLSELKQKYKAIAGKQYDDILKSYILYKGALEKKKMLCSSLKS
ncbi:uncharacterized protein LOC114344097 [Diabrotica virgifera virgifera]|uniref:Uncharacterized protein LOC114344097 n=1 Tax=Diabrotica virgifera virgifera TaxID=50390 RepID=A0A6P7H421_DIAVI|nr:uncharacterized protein LOC114344097 [Diabrotica virgifera virgifera]